MTTADKGVEDRVQEVLAAADRRIAADGYDPVTVVAGAMLALAESWAQDARLLCPRCARRRIPRLGQLCQPCTQEHEAILAQKRRWWDANGATTPSRVNRGRKPEATG